MSVWQWDSWRRRVNKTAKFAFQATENLKPCFDYLQQKKKMKLVNIGPIDIFNGNHKLTLGLIFQIILFVQIDNIEVDGLKGMHGLLLWVNRQIEPYGQKVNDFTESWRDGKAFAALAAALCDNYDFGEAEAMGQDDRHSSAYNKMEDDLKVVRLLDPEDFHNEEIDDKSVLTYVSSIFNAVATDDESRRHVQAIDRVAMLAKKTGSMILKYEKEARAYNKLLDDKIEYFHETEPRDSKDCRRLKEEFANYQKTEKEDIKNRKTDLESMLSDIHESERAENRPLYIPPEGLGPNEISQKYRDFEEAEHEYEQRLLEKFKYFLTIERLMNQLDLKCQRLSDRLKDNIKQTDLNDLGDSVAECNQKLAELDNLVEEDDDTEKEMKELHDLLDAFPKDCSEYPEALDKVEAVEDLQDEWEDHKKEYRDRLEENLERQQELERLERDMVKEADKIENNLDHVEMLLKTSNGADSFETAEANASAEEAHRELDQVKDAVEDLREKQKQLLDNGKEDEVQRHPLKPIEDRIRNLERELKEKEDALDEINRHTEQCNQALQEYDELANAVQQYVEDNSNDLRAKKNATPEEQMELIRQKKEDYNRPPECYRVMKEKEKECRDIGTNTASFGPINSVWTEYGKHLDRKEAKLKDDEDRKKMESLSPDEEKVLEQIYKELNTDGKGLTADQLREALQAMGINMSLNDVIAKLTAMGYKVGPNMRLGLPDLKQFLLELKATKNNKEDIQNSWKYLAKNKDKIADADVDKYFKDCESYSYLKESMPPDESGLCDYHEWTEAAFKH